MNDDKVSVLISVYAKELEANLSAALESLRKQEYQPDEVVIIKDGPLGEGLDSIITAFSGLFKEVKIIALKTNMGLGGALNEGLKACSYELVARMDSDDIALLPRLKLQREFLIRNTDISALGSDIAEFIDEDCILRIKKMPVSSQQLYKYGKFRNPLNHMSVMFRKADIIKVGGYLPFPGLEDYHLWSRLLAGGFKIANTGGVLINARLGRDFSKRRGGFKYFLQYFKLRAFQMKIGYTNFFEFIYGSILAAGICLIPPYFRDRAYKMLRK